MRTLNDALDHEVPCDSVDYLCMQAQECTGRIPAGQRHFRSDNVSKAERSDDFGKPEFACRVCVHCIRYSNWERDYKNEPIITRVELTYCDQRRLILRGEAAVDWLAPLAISATFDRSRPKRIPWEYIPPPSDQILTRSGSRVATDLERPMSQPLKTWSMQALREEEARLKEIHEEIARRLIVRAGVSLFLYRADGLFLLMKRLGSHGAGTWGLPGGHIDYGETVVSAAARETAEELNLRIDPGSIRIIGASEAVFAPEHKHYITIMCAAPLPAGAEPRLAEPDKCEDLRWAGGEVELPDPLFLPLNDYIAANGVPDFTRGGRHGR